VNAHDDIVKLDHLENRERKLEGLLEEVEGRARKSREREGLREVYYSILSDERL